MKEYALYDNGVGSPVPCVKLDFRAGSQAIKLFSGHEMFAKSDHLTPITEQDYNRLVKEEKAEKEMLSKKDGFATEILYRGTGFTNAANQRGR